MLLISSYKAAAGNTLYRCFNLVIEMLLISSPKNLKPYRHRHKFQSRNRDAFDFKTTEATAPNAPGNLFQSRNRDAFDFKEKTGLLQVEIVSFNLVIEMLLISSKQKLRSKREDAIRLGFNLVIEMLLISSINVRSLLIVYIY